MVGNRIFLITGSPKTGKTTLAVSASQFAPDTLPAKPGVDCDDTLVIQLDSDGTLGAADAGLFPKVLDLSGAGGYENIDKELAKAIPMIREAVTKGEIRNVCIDLTVLDREIRLYAAGDRGGAKSSLGNADVTLSGDVNWNLVSARGLTLMRAFKTLPCTVIGMAHLRRTDNNYFLKDGEKKAVEKVNDIRGIAGDKAQFTADLSKGVYDPWVHACSGIFVTEVRQVQVGSGLKPKIEKQYVTHTGATPEFEAGARRSSVLQGMETRSLNAILRDMYNFQTK